MPETKSKVTKTKNKTQRTSKKGPEEIKSTASTKKANQLSVPLFNLDGQSGGNLDLPKEIFGVEVNKKLLAQALRVYLNNQKGHYSNTKTRGEVKGSTRKIFRQKGTGHARHGGIRAPIFVGGGIALGPKVRNIQLELPKKMKKKALLSALSQKASDQRLIGVSGLEKATGKTSQMAKLAHLLFPKSKSVTSVLFISGEKNDLALRAVGNIEGLAMTTADQLNAFEVIRYQNLVLTKEAVEKLGQRFSEKGEK